MPLLLAACASSFQRDYVLGKEISSKDRHLAVPPLANLTSHPQAGRIVGEILATELYSVPSFRITEPPGQGPAGLDEDLELAMDTAAAQKLGRELGVDTVVYGSVGEFRYKRGVDQSPAVGLNLRMIDVPTGRVLWAASMSGTSSGLFGQNDSLNELAQRVCAKAVSSMLAQAGLLRTK
ncbi:MAG: CsgG/HfaB family protein [Desulfovibrionaceae bacterium]|nr:CsgG/HfaB family protein [Desulfovibrionaceae bacterium]